MQTPKKSVGKSSSSEVPKRSSPIAPRSARQISVTVSESGSASLACPGSKTPKNKSPKLAERKSPRSPVTEKKCPNRVTKLETQITQLQEDLEKAKEQLASAELWKKKAEEEAEETNKQRISETAKLEEVQQQIKDLSAAEDGRVQELHKIGQERDRAWQSELEAVQKQHLVDSAALLSATNEVERLKQQIEMLSSFEVAQAKQAEVADSKLWAAKDEMAEMLSLVSSLKVQLETSQKSEEEFRDLVNQTQVQLEIVKTVIEMLNSDGLKVTEALDSTVTELNEYKARVRSLKEAMRKADANNSCTPPEHDECALRAELESLNSEVKHLKDVLEEMEVKYNEEQIKCIMQVQSVYEEAERMKIQSGIRESTLQATIEEAKGEVAGLKECVLEREAQLTDMKERLNSVKQGGQGKGTDHKLEAQKSDAEVVNLRARLEDKERTLKDALDENELLKSEMEKKEAERVKNQEAAKAEIEMARAAEREALTTISIVTEEADKSSRKATQVAEQLEATQTANSEVEMELQRLRIQCGQWRKAAEAAAAILTTGNNGNLMERLGSFGPDNNSLGGKLLNSPFSDDMDEESPKKKNNVLKKIGVLWKKGQK